jgi:hydrophobe/amphiphile efflux-1 (HAE1) family protein
MKITAVSVKRKLALSLIIVPLVVMGVYGIYRLPVDFLPDITYPLVKVIIYWRGATPEEINTSIADPIERQIATVDGLDYMESSSIEGMYYLQANFQYGMNIDVAYQDVLAAMARAIRKLPKDIDAPIVFKADPTQISMVDLVIRSDSWNLVALRTWADTWLNDELKTVPGVAGTEVMGGLKREIRVHLDPESLEKYGLSLPKVANRLNQENIEQFAGRITSGPEEVITRTMGEYENLDEIKEVILTKNEKGNVLVRDIGNVVDHFEEVRVITRFDGKPSVKVMVFKEAGANTMEVAKAVANRIQTLRPSLPGGIQVDMVENQADYIEAAVTGVRNTVLEAIGLVMLVIYLFLGSWRQVLVMLLALPVTLIINFGIMKLLGFSINIFSLSGLVVAIGVILDNSIVVLENITRLRHENQDEPMETLVISGSQQVGPAVAAATFSFFTLFLPFLLVPGLTSLLFKELILIVASIVLISLLVAITMTPMLTDLLLGKIPKDRRKSRFESFFDRLSDLYGESLGWALKRKWMVAGAFVTIFILAGLLSGRLGSEFLPRIDDGRIMVKVKLPTGTSVKQTDEALSQLEAKLSGDPLIQSMFTLVGGNIQGTNVYEIANEGEVDLQLVPRHERNLTTDDFMKRIRPLVSQVQIPGGKVMVVQMKTRGFRKLGTGDVEVEIKGPEIDQLFSLARQVSSTMNEMKHFTNVYMGMDLSKPEYQVKIDRARAGEMGVSVSDVATALRSLITGAVATRFKEGDEYYNIRVMVSEKELKSLQNVQDLPIMYTTGGFLRLRDVAEVVPATGPVEIVRLDQVKTVRVISDASGVSVGRALEELREGLKKVGLPVGYAISFGGQAQMMADMQKELLAIFGFSVFFTFALLGIQFNSLKLPGLIIGVLPVCLSGAIFLLLVTGLPLGATVIIGVMLVVAATVNGGVLLLTFAEEFRKSGQWSPSQAILNAAKIRLRPCLMVSLLILMSMIPLALKIEEGSDMLQPMAVAAIGGIFVEILVVLFLVPSLYVIFTKEKMENGLSIGKKVKAFLLQFFRAFRNKNESAKKED